MFFLLNSYPIFEINPRMLNFLSKVYTVLRIINVNVEYSKICKLHAGAVFVDFGNGMRKSF